MIYLYPNSDTFAIFYNKNDLPEKYHKDLIEIESLPEGEGILRQAGDGSFYYEHFPKPIDPDPVEPELTQEQIQLQTLLNTEFLVIMSEINGQ